MKVIILVGGRGTRLPRSARDIPKALVPVRGRTILDRQLDALRQHGLLDIRLALGFRADQIIAHLAATGRDNIDYVIESKPLGTGGAVKLASRGMAEPFLVLNGDTLADFDFSGIISGHQPGSAIMVSHWRDDARDFGLLDISNGRIRAFLEKPAEPRSGFINAGCYILEPRHLEHIEEEAFMLEQDIFPYLASSGVLQSVVHSGFWEDLGTEQRLAAICDSSHEIPS